jgi:hypothetical protein
MQLPDKLITTLAIMVGIIPKAKTLTVWKPGQSGNPKGRPKDQRTIAVLKNDLELAVREELSPVKVTQVVNRMIKIATESRDTLAAVAAAKVVLGMAISKPHVQEQSSGSKGFTIVIENATLQALQKPPIDAEFTQIEVNANGVGSEKD